MYVPLRVHGHHSLLVGVDPPTALLERAARIGVPALALADVDSLAGLVEFLEAARAYPGVRPLVAAELSDTCARPGRLIALVESEEGYRNLCRLISARRARGADFDLVAAALEHQEGLLLLVDHPRLLLGLFGHVPPRRLLCAVPVAALQAERLRDPRRVAGTSRNTHRSATDTPRVAAPPTTVAPSGLDEPRTAPPARAVPAATLVDAARATGAALVAVPDVYYALPGDASDHRVRVAIQHNALLDDLDPAWVAEVPAHLPTPGEMNAFYAGLPDVAGAWPTSADDPRPPAVQRTVALADACRYTPPLGGVFFPEVDLPEGDSPYSRLCELAFTGARKRYRPLRPEVLRRLDEELSTIQRLGFAPYFLLVQRIARFATEAGIPHVGRGSAADSLVAYCLELTDADPLHYRLPFERFLNPARRDRPDIDLDFCWRRRDEVLEHVFELFGVERTAMICTLNRFGLRSAFREAALAHGIPPVEVGHWSSRLPLFPTHPEELAEEERELARNHAPAESRAASAPLPPQLARNPLALALRALPEASAFPFDDVRFAHVLVAAERLLDAPRHFGLHPGGVVVAPGRITDLVPCQPSSKGPVVTQFDKNGVEAIGLVKMDLLGNRALTVIDDCLTDLRAGGVEVELDALPEDDPATAETLRHGRTLGCFQIESPGMRHLLQQIDASTMDDVIQAVALIRPGPAGSGMKDAYVRRARGLEDPTPPHPRLVDVLWDTRGVMLYQEDVMQAAARVAGLSLADADELRRALQKRRLHELDELRARFFDGCAGEDIDAEAAAPVWELIANFAAFAFCKAHAVTYGRLAYRIAWLKTHHPAQLLIAFLRSETGYYPARVYVEEARRLGVPILGPDINKSAATFTLVEHAGRPALRVGLGQAKGLTERTLAALFRARHDEGSFLSLPDFLKRTGARTDEVETLVQCGAFDAFDRTRPELLWRLHLLRTPQKRPPRNTALDGGQLAACRELPDGNWGARNPGLGRAVVPDQGALLFPASDAPALVLPGLPDVPPDERGRREFELLGLTLRAHPVTLFPCPGEQRSGQAPSAARGTFHSSRAGVRAVNPVACAELTRHRGARITLRGWPAATRRHRIAGGELMRFVTLEDESGLAEAVLFPDVYARDGARLREPGVLLITGTVDEQMGAYTLRVERVW